MADARSDAPRDECSAKCQSGLNDDQAEQIGSERRNLRAENGFAIGVAVKHPGNREKHRPHHARQRASTHDQDPDNQHGKRDHDLRPEQIDATHMQRHAERACGHEQRGQEQIQLSNPDNEPN
jgi:hypothetical protein